jgi:hypothetical protein
MFPETQKHIYERKVRITLLIFLLYSLLMIDSKPDLIAFVKYRMEILSGIQHTLCHANEYH